MKNIKLVQWSIVAALAGFLFGFDTVVISGANQPVKELWNTSEIFHGVFIMSMALWGTVIGAIFGGTPTEIYGRKVVLLWVGVFYILSSLGTAMADDPYTFSFFRFLGGVAIGVSSVVAPTYISEISVSKIRGRLVAMYQFNIVFGIMVAYVSNYLLQGFGGNEDWRWMLGVQVIPATIYTLMVAGLAESPRWLITHKKDLVKARNVLSQMGVKDSHSEIRHIQQSNQMVATIDKSSKLFSGKYRRPITLAFFIAFFNQFSGINFILYYAPQILERAGLATSESLFNSIAIGGVNLVFTLVGLYLLDRIGRKKLLLIGSYGYIISLAMVAYSFYAGVGPQFLMTFLLLFIAAHAIGQGAVIWVFISEIFPNDVRALGQSFGASVHWICAAVITLITPVFIDKSNGIFKNPWPVFAFFAAMMVWQLWWVSRSVPETKEVSLEELEKELVKTR
jgi:sugar porter (SP) family MFS transporter